MKIIKNKDITPNVKHPLDHKQLIAGIDFKKPVTYKPSRLPILIIQILPKRIFTKAFVIIQANKTKSIIKMVLLLKGTIC